MTPAAARRFPLLGRPRPTAAVLPDRVQEIADIAHGAAQDGVDGLAQGAQALNKAALVASDCSMTDLARRLCWQHIDVYRAAGRPLTVLQARYMLEPVLNLARLHLRAGDGDQALHQVKAMYRAVASGCDLIVDGRVLPLDGLAGTRHEHHKLREWVWLHLLGEGVRALALAGRWDDAAAHAHAYRGIGRHLMEGRQAMILAHCLNGATAAARAALGESTPEQPWERQVAACLTVMCTSGAPPHRDVETMVSRFVERQPTPGYAVFRAQLGLTVAALAGTTDPEAARRTLGQVADEVIRSGDGYAAREVLRYRGPQTGWLTGEQGSGLSDLLAASGLGAGRLPGSLLRSLVASTHNAAEALATSLPQPNDHAGTWTV